MERYRLVLLGSLLTWLTWLSFPATAGETLNGTIGNLPLLAESNDKGILVDFMRAMQRAYPEGTISFEVLPFKRSLQGAIDGVVDFHAPLLEDKSKSEEQLGFAYSTVNIWDVTFALYTNRFNKGINPGNLAKYNIETDAGHVNYFDFPIHASTCIECSLKKVDEGRIDGYIFAALESDTLVRRFKLKNIKSVAYRVYAGKFALSRGARKKKVDALLTMLFKRTKANGDYQKTVGKIVDYYRHWKPIQ